MDQIIIMSLRLPLPSEPLVALVFLSQYLVGSRIWRSFYLGKAVSPIGVGCGLEKGIFLLLLPIFRRIELGFVIFRFQEYRIEGRPRS